MEANKVVLELKDYNILRDFYNGMNKGSYVKIRYDYIGNGVYSEVIHTLKESEVVKDLSKEIEVLHQEAKNKLKPPPPPLARVIRQGIDVYCNNCNSTMTKSGFLHLFGERLCDNDKCKNSKTK